MRDTAKGYLATNALTEALEPLHLLTAGDGIHDRRVRVWRRQEHANVRGRTEEWEADATAPFDQATRSVLPN